LPESSFLFVSAPEKRSRDRNSAGGGSFFVACAMSAPEGSGLFAFHGGRTTNHIATTAANPNAGASQRARQSRVLGRIDLISFAGAA
jgi:hypothetical protein